MTLLSPVGVTGTSRCTGKRFSNGLRRNNGSWLIFIKLASILTAGNAVFSPLYHFGESHSILSIPYCFFSRKVGAENALILRSRHPFIFVYESRLFEDESIIVFILRSPFFLFNGFRRGEDEWTLGSRWGILNLASIMAP